MDKKVKIYFKGLDGIRFFAALVVIFYHIEILKELFGFINCVNNVVMHQLGPLGVTLFFVLSGFLITYLLLSEKNKFNSISIKDFYIRRILRIWPLYLLIVTLSLFVFPKISFFYIPGWSDSFLDKFILKVVLFYSMLPNVLFVAFFIPYCQQTWSIGVEEQFYLIWPIIMKYVRNYLLCFIFIIVIILAIQNLLKYHGYLPSFLLPYFPKEGLFSSYKINYYLHLLYKYFSDLRFSCMAIGAIGAYILYFEKKYLLRVIYKKTFQSFIYFLIVISIVFRFKFIQYFYHEYYSLLFCVVILNVSTNPKSILKLENPILNFLGRISYGIYMYHQIAIVIVMVFFKNLFNFKYDDLLSNSLLYILSVAFTILFSAVSYHFFEHKFLKLKNRFAKITK